MNPFSSKKRKVISSPKIHQQLIQPLEPRRLMSMTPALDLIPDASASTISGYSPSQISTAYGFSGLTFGSSKVTANGAGQTIAIVDAYNDPDIANDLKTFDSQFGLATANLKVVNQTGGSTLPASNGGWAEEISLDVEWVHAIAPGASILLVETNSSNTSDLLAGVKYARTVAGVSVVSMSWGGSEFNGETSYDSDFTTPSGHTGMTFVAASGDDGSFYGVDWPASSPDVLSVGGTSLSTSSTSGNYSSETGWSDSGGGVSQYEGEPEYQNNVQAEYARTVPDVSADANPSTGVAVYDSDSYDGYSGWLDFGGTSAAAPQWAGLIAIADQGRVLNKLGTLDGATNTLPTLYSLENSASTYSADFHDITTGATSFSIEAGTGYDLVTGIGSAKANNLIPALVSSKTSTPLTLTTAVVYVPQPPRFFGWYFLATDHATSPTEILATTAASFSTTVNGTTSLAIKQALFDSSLPSTSPEVSHTADISLPTNSPSPAAAMIGGTGASPASTSTLPALGTLGSASTIAQSAAQTLEQDLLEVSRYAQQVIADLGRGMAIDMAHEEIAAMDSALGTIASQPTGTAAAVAATVVALACLENGTVRDEPKKPSVFSRRMIVLADS